MPICNNCSRTFPNRIKIDGKTKSLSNRKYCLTCSPYGDHNTKRLDRETQMLKAGDPLPETKVCRLCTFDLPIINFGIHKKRADQLYIFPYCKSCDSKRQAAVHLERKAMAVAYKGGKCRACGYCKSLRCLDFHHRDPEQKDFDVSKFTLRDFNLLKPELDKCDLLCKNCHGEEHERLALT